MTKKVYIETLGCQMNKSDSERMFGLLSSVGYERTLEPKEATLLMINTCSIRQLSEDKAYSYLGIWGKWKRSNPEIKIAMCGCVAQQAKKEVTKRMPFVDLVFGTHNIYQLPELISRLENGETRVCSVLKEAYKCDETQFEIKRENGLSAWLPIIEGCNFFCTYCVVPYTRGRQRSRDFDTIIHEARDIAKQGFKEITLLGQTVDSYGNDIDDEKSTLSNLLREISKIDEVKRIRFVTSYPSEITDELIDTVKELDKVCEYFHIPMQSGSSAVLDKMRRRYTREEYLELCNKIRTKIPNVAITSDFIAGFPGETDEQFEETLEVMDEVCFEYSNVAAYSPRKQTPAATWKDLFVDELVKKERLQRLNEKVKETALRANEKFIGKRVEILVETSKIEDGKTILTGRTRNNTLCHFEGDESLVRELVFVKIKEASAWCFKAELEG